MGGEAGYLKFGAFDDQVDRAFHQETFSNFGDSGASFQGGFEDFWSGSFGDEDHPITASEADDDYDGDQKIGALYGMMDLPLSATVDLIGGLRWESTQIGIVNSPEADALWFPPGSPTPVHLQPGDADVEFSQDNALPAIGLVYQPADEVTLRGSYAQTVARQTFKELTPIIQQEFLGGPIFIGNPDLVMSELQNYDLRADYTPFAGGLVSASWFSKSIKNPIEYVQQVGVLFNYTTAENYPHGELNGYEFELRQDLGVVWESLKGLSIGANATFIDSSVTLPASEAAGFDLPGIQAPMSSREMTDAPDYIYNLYATYDLVDTGTLFGVFYSVTGQDAARRRRPEQRQLRPEHLRAGSRHAQHDAGAEDRAVPDAAARGEEPHQSRDPDGLQLAVHRAGRDQHVVHEGGRILDLPGRELFVLRHADDTHIGRRRRHATQARLWITGRCETEDGDRGAGPRARRVLRLVRRDVVETRRRAGEGAADARGDPRDHGQVGRDPADHLQGAQRLAAGQGDPRRTPRARD
jgi:hypothetical protein